MRGQEDVLKDYYDQDFSEFLRFTDNVIFKHMFDGTALDAPAARRM